MEVELLVVRMLVVSMLLVVGLEVISLVKVRKRRNILTKSRSNLTLQEESDQFLVMVEVEVHRLVKILKIMRDATLERVTILTPLEERDRFLAIIEGDDFMTEEGKEYYRKIAEDLYQFRIKEMAETQEANQGTSAHIYSARKGIW